MFYGGLTYSSHPVSLRRGARDDLGLRGGRPHRQRRPARPGHARPPRAARGEAPERRGDPQPRPVRDHRPRPEPRPVDAADAVQRHVGRDEGDRQVPPRERAVHDDRQQLDPHEPAAVHHRGPAAPRASRSSTGPSTSPTRRSPDAGPIGRTPPMTTASGSLPRRPDASRARRLRPRRSARARRRRRRRRARPRGAGRSSGKAPSGSAATRGGSTAPIAGHPGRLRARPAVQVADRRRPVAAARLGHRPRRSSTRPSAAARRSARSSPARPLFTFGEALVGFALGGAARSRPRRSCSSTRGSPSGRSCRTSSPRRPCRSSPSRRSSSSRSRPTGCRSMAVAAYLTFFPVTIASLRGLRAVDPRAFELFRSYAATRRQILWQLRLPTSVPYLFSGVPGRGRGVDHRRDHRRADRGRRRPGSAARSSTTTSTTSRRPSGCGRRS